MNIYNEAISDNSVWINATPNDFVLCLPFYITEAGRFFARKEYRVERESHDSLLFLFTVKGSGTVIAGDRTFELPPGRACIIDCRQPHKYYSKTAPWEFIWFHFGGSAATRAMLDALYSDGIKALPMKNGAKAIPERLLDRVADGSAESCLEMSRDIHDVINSLFSASISAGDDKPALLRRDEIMDTAEYIKKNYSEQIGVKELADRAHMSLFYFSRVFRRVMGTSPYNYITVCRLNKSKEMLLSSDTKVAAIAADCGFPDASRYISQFKKYTGMTPAKYRTFLKSAVS